MFGPIDFLIDNMMLPFLKFSYASIFPNYAIGIILLTILIKVLLYPLTQKQFHSMKAMQKLQPKMKELREKHKKDPQKLQQEMLSLYKETGINPLGGCLPMLVQLPFLFALFYTMSSDKFKVLISEEGVFPGLFSFWLPNLSEPDNLFILPIVIGIATYTSQKLTPMTTDSPQTKVVISYADPSVNHKGIIYRASNWLYQGNEIGAADAYMYRYPNTDNWLSDRAIGEQLGTNGLKGVLDKIPDMEYKKKLRKHRYIYFLCSKKEKKRLINNLKHPLVDYHHHDNDEMIPKVEKKYWELNG